MSSPTREQMSHSDLCFPSGEHIIFKCYVFPYTGTDISSDVFFFTPEAYIPSKMGSLYLGTHWFWNKDINYKLQKILSVSFQLQAIGSLSLSKDGN